MMKEKQISELILKHKLLKERFNERQGIQEKSRKELKTYENLNKRYTKNKFVQTQIRYLEQIIFENKTLLNALQKQCLDVKKKIKKLNKEQNIINNEKDKLEKQIKLDAEKKKKCKDNNVRLLYYAELEYDYPYKVFTDLDKLLKEIKNGK